MRIFDIYFQKQYVTLSKVFSNVVLYITIVLLAGCSTTGSHTLAGQPVSDFRAAFKNSEIRLTCGISCSGAYGYIRYKLQSLHDNELWYDLADSVADSGFNSDQGYYYLGRAAEELGYIEAARTYYRLGIAASNKCDTLLINICDGLSFPRDIDSRLGTLAISLNSPNNQLQDEPHNTQYDVTTQKLNDDSLKFGRFFSLIIGNNKYKHLPHLKTAINDARAIAMVLGQHYNHETEVLINSTRSEIIKSLSKYREILSEKDNLLIYYAGHGWLDSEVEEGYWLPIDAEQSTPTNWISNSTITGYLRAIKANHIMVIADSCYSGSLTRGLQRVGVKKRDYFDVILKKKSRTVLTSGGMEPVADSGGKGKHSVFAAALIDILSNNNRILEGNSIFLGIKKPVVLNSDQIPNTKYQNTQI